MDMRNRSEVVKHMGRVLHCDTYLDFWIHWTEGRFYVRSREQQQLEIRGSPAGLDTKDCQLARDHQIWLSGEQISMQNLPDGQSNNWLFC
jgi:hypothetical protein